MPGVQGVGVVEQSDSVPAGQRVWFATSAGMQPGDGGMAERCVVPDVDVVPIADRPDDTTVAALGTSAFAAWMCLTWKARLQPGETVLALGAGGAVGQSVIGAAKVLGAGRVVAVCRPGRQHRTRPRGRGRRGGRPARRPEARWPSSHQPGGDPVDVVIDPVGGAAARRP